jgi:hypothetical protein
MELVFLYVAYIESYIELRVYFCTRALCCGQKLMKLTSTATFEPFSNVRHDRYGSSLDLPYKPEIPRKCSYTGHLIDGSSELSGFLPGNQIFKVFYLTQHSSLSTQHCFTNFSRKSLRNTFPSALRGNTLTNSTMSGFLKLAKRW